MKYLDRFTVPLSGNNKDVSEHSFELKKDFFTHFEDAEIIDSDVTVVMTLRKSISAFEMHFVLTGDFTVSCDRCLEPMIQSIDYSTELIIKYGEKYEEIDDKVVVIPITEEQINIAPYIFEFAKLALPIQRTHPEGECNEEMLEQMQKYQRKEEEEKDTDSRWDALAALKGKLEN